MPLKEPLCRTCRHYLVSNAKYVERIGDREVSKDARNYCNELYISIIREATQCYKYDDRRVPHLSEMKEMAYIWEKRNLIGIKGPVYEFVKPEKK